MNSSIACRYPRFDSRERRLSRTADLLWSRSGRPSFGLSRFGFAEFLLPLLLIPTASIAVGHEPTLRLTRRPFFSQVNRKASVNTGRLPDTGPVSMLVLAISCRSQIPRSLVPLTCRSALGELLLSFRADTDTCETWTTRHSGCSDRCSIGVFMHSMDCLARGAGSACFGACGHVRTEPWGPRLPDPGAAKPRL